MSEMKEVVRGYMKPLSSFKTLKEWEIICNRALELQRFGVDSRGGEIGCKTYKFCNEESVNQFVKLVSDNFRYLLFDEVEKWDLLTRKNVLDFIEDFTNHRFWGFEKEFSHYFPDMSSLRFSFLYSRGDIEPYVLLDENYTMQMYGSTDNPKRLLHYTSMSGLARLRAALENGEEFDISSFTVADRPFFRKESNVVVEFIGNVRAGFRSDIKSYAVEGGRKACNMYRLEYPGSESNICYELETCDGQLKTSLWNEYIATPLKIISTKKV